MADGWGNVGGPVGDRQLVEDAVKYMLSTAQSGWTQLHAEFEPSLQHVTAAVTAVGVGTQALTVPPETVGLLGEHLRRADAAGAPWRRMVIDCHSDGRLAVSVEPPQPGRVPATGRHDPRKWLRRGLVATTAALLLAAAVVFVFAWRWSPLPEADIIAVPPPPPRQQEAFQVITKWLDGTSRSDAAAIRAATCASPTQDIADWIATVERRGNIQATYFPEAVSAFRDSGAEVWAEVALRIRPIDDRAKQLAENQQSQGGFFFNRFTLVDENGLKVCQTDTTQQ